MKQSSAFIKTRKEAPSDADSKNARYLVRASYVEKHMAGAYALLPLGFRVFKKIENIIREEMNALGGQEVLMNVLQPRELWEETGRWDSAIDVFYKLKDSRGKEMNLAPTHEEQVVDIARKKIRSYKDLPFSLYQIQTKFRNEPRAKSGLLRGREFSMKDLYSFHADQESFENFYEKSKEAYLNVYSRMGLEARVVEASGGIFSKFSHEFQVFNEIGEDSIFYCEECSFAQNKEIAEVHEGEKCPKCGKAIIKIAKAIEVGNIFPLGKKFSEPMKATFLDKEGKEQTMIMGCYGIGLTRTMATIVEEYFDEGKNKMLWPKEVAPYQIHILSLEKNKESENIEKELQKSGIEVLYDDRDLSAGEKFADSDLLGIPLRVVISEKSLKAGGYEFLSRKENKTEIISSPEVLRKKVKEYYVQ